VRGADVGVAVTVAPSMRKLAHVSVGDGVVVGARVAVNRKRGVMEGVTLGRIGSAVGVAVGVTVGVAVGVICANVHAPCIRSAECAAKTIAQANAT